MNEMEALIRTSKALESQFKRFGRVIDRPTLKAWTDALNAMEKLGETNLCETCARPTSSCACSRQRATFVSYSLTLHPDKM